MCVLQCAHRFPATPGNNCPDVDAPSPASSSRLSVARCIASRRVFFSSYTPFIHHPFPRAQSRRALPRALWFSPSPPGHRGGRSGDCRRVSRRATTTTRATTRTTREIPPRAHRPIIASHARIGRDDTSSYPRDDARARAGMTPTPVDTAPTRARRDDTRHTSHEILLTSRARSRANHRPHAVPGPMARTTDIRDRGLQVRARSPTNDRARRPRRSANRPTGEKKPALASPRARPPRDARAGRPELLSFTPRARWITTKGTQW